ncbi:hypothetical protein [Streptosporangium roseum]|uniref:hypothetical protein n=1 Tax=Streptosporangium roseum TaxID=2001 RepID=UPI0011D1CFD5|nr:hypothetical protein [Streptosporangium roseum]
MTSPSARREPPQPASPRSARRRRWSRAGAWRAAGHRGRGTRVVDQDTGKIKTDKDGDKVYESVLLAEDEFGRIELVKVGGKQKSKTFRTKALANNFLSTLRQAAKRGRDLRRRDRTP